MPTKFGEHMLAPEFMVEYFLARNPVLTSCIYFTLFENYTLDKDTMKDRHLCLRLWIC